MEESNTTEEIIRESQSAKTELTERWSALQTAWGRLQGRIQRLFELYEEQESSQNDNASVITERNEEITRLKDEIRQTIDQITELNPDLERMETQMNDKLNRLPGDRDRTDRTETDNVTGDGDGDLGDGGLGAEVVSQPSYQRGTSDPSSSRLAFGRRTGGGLSLEGGYRYKTPKNRRKTKSKSKTRSKSKSKSPSKSKKSKKSRRKSKY